MTIDPNSTGFLSHLRKLGGGTSSQNSQKEFSRTQQKLASEMGKQMAVKIQVILEALSIWELLCKFDVFSVTSDINWWWLCIVFSYSMSLFPKSYLFLIMRQHIQEKKTIRMHTINSMTIMRMKEDLSLKRSDGLHSCWVWTYVWVYSFRELLCKFDVFSVTSDINWWWLCIVFSYSMSLFPKSYLFLIMRQHIQEKKTIRMHTINSMTIMRMKEDLSLKRSDGLHSCWVWTYVWV